MTTIQSQNPNSTKFVDVSNLTIKINPKLSS
jgi:hypothetical protein